MKRMFLAIAVAMVMLLCGSISAQDSQPKGYHALGAKILFIDHGWPNNASGLDITNGLEVQYKRNFSDYLNLVIPLKIGVADVVDDINNRNITSLDAVLQVQYFKNDNRLIPYALAGGGVSLEDFDNSNIQFPLGLGINYRVGKNSFLNLQGEYRISSAADRNNAQLGLGYIYRIDKSDRDGDGIADSQDQCPDQIGVASLNGCPDRDADGIADAQDLCPDDAGTLETNGCPDRDADGVVDSKDNCPDTAGTIEGCPDSDGDLVVDKDDKCPEEKGLVGLQGCPDRDGDNVADAMDACPDEAGLPTNGGCPIKDRDGDGVSDEGDPCPDTPGPVTTAGCPDRDGDGVADKNDRCPDKPGPYAGCPDTDNDGVIDADDRCPDEAGPVDNKGCPEVEEEDQSILDFAMQAVQFELGKSELKEESNEILDQVTEILKRYVGYSVRIAGHTDSIGDADDNLKLSEDRAKACYDYLIAAGIQQQRLTYKGYGESQPRASNERSAGRRENRRVEFQMYIE